MSDKQCVKCGCYLTDKEYAFEKELRGVTGDYVCSECCANTLGGNDPTTQTEEE